MFKGSNSEFLMARFINCRTCDRLTGFFTNDDHLKGFIERYKPDLSLIQNGTLRQEIKELVKGCS
jgi:hypothetical protein